MNRNAKNVMFEVLNVAIYALFWGKFINVRVNACVKILTNIMSARDEIISKLDEQSVLRFDIYPPV